MIIPETPPIAEGQRVRFFSQVTQRTYFHIDDALAIGKLKLVAGSYTRGQGASVQVYCYVELYEFLADMHGILRGKVVPRKAFTGSRVEGEVQSRTYSIGSQNGEKPKVFITIENGPGILTKNGAVTPGQGAKEKVNVAFTIDKARAMAIQMLMLGQAWTAEQMRGMGGMISGYPAYGLSHIPVADVTQADGVRATGNYPQVQDSGSRNHKAAPSPVENGLMYGDGTPVSNNTAEVEAFQAFVQSKRHVPENQQVLRGFHIHLKNQS